MATDIPPGDDGLDALRRRFLDGGDERAMEEFVRRTRPRLLGAARRIGHPQDAEDAVQAAFHSLLQRGQEPTDGPVVAWLLTAVVRIAYRKKASSRRREDIARRLAPTNPEPDPSSRLAAAEEVRALHRALDRLPARYRDALVLHHLQGLSVADTALLLEAPESTIKARLRRGRALLRSRLPVSLHLAICAVPWGIADAGAALDPRLQGILGGAMKAKTAALVVLAAGLAAGTAGWALLRSDDSPPGSGSRPAGGASTGPGAGRNGTASGPGSFPKAGQRPSDEAIVVVPATPDSRGTTARPVPPGEPASPASPGDPGGIPAAVRDAAGALGIPDRALRAAWAAYLSGKGNTGKGTWNIVAPEALEALRAEGEDGFRAMVALLRGGTNGTWFRDLMQATWSAGREDQLFRIAEDPAVHDWSRNTALCCLGVADTAATRDFLVGFLSRETSPHAFYGAAAALADLREARGTEACVARFEEKAWGPAIRSGLMSYVARMDPDTARRTLPERLRRPEADLLVETLRSLAVADPDLARNEAAALLDGPRRTSLPEAVIADLRTLAGRTQER